MFLLFVLDACINMVKNLQRIPWMYSLTGAIYITMQERLIQKDQR